MKLYSFSGSCGLASHIVLNWIGEPFEVKLMQKEETKSPEYLKLNPMGKVPLLDDDGFILSENAAVLTYLADKYPQASLAGGDDIKKRALVDHWLGLVNSEIHPAFKPLFGATAYLEDKAVIEKTKANAREQLHKVFAIVDAQLGQTDYIAGARSVVDAYLFVTVLWTGFVNVDISDLPHIAAFKQRMQADPAVQKALKDEDLA